jgi:DNA-binding CsgD family transcriptional regulator
MPIAKKGPDIAPATARAVESLGRAEFYDRLLELLGVVAGHDLAALVRYSRSSPPDLVLPRVEPNEAIQAYHRHFFALDPFYTHWVSGGGIGVYRLRAMASDIGRSRYAREFLSAMSIHDEIAVFLPAIGEASPTLILDRARRSFSEAEVAQARRLFPLLAALHRRHLQIFVTTGTDLGGSPLGQGRPLRLLDQRGAQIFATQAWDDLVGQHGAGLSEALEVIALRGPCTVPIAGRRLLRRTRLGPDFGPAPNGFCDEVGPDPAAEAGSVSGLPPSLAQGLTEREQEVVLLTLQGYPVVEIARRLGLSRGTVKNYRLAIYRKLDITTERELFGEYLAAMRPGPRSS